MRSIGLTVVLLLLNASHLGCRSDLEPVVVVRIPDVPAGLVSISVENQLGSRGGSPLSFAVTQPGELRFGVSVATAATETLTLKLQGVAANDCIAATGELEVPLSGARFPHYVDFPVSLLPEQRCTLTLTMRTSSGVSGKVTSSPAALDCSTGQSTCTYSFAPSSTATLDLVAETDIKSYFTWTGSCQGNGVCKVPLDRKRDEQVAFDPRECLAPSLCFHSPTPRDAVFTAISAGKDSSAWAVGYSTGQAAARLVDGRWLFVPTGLSVPLRGVWAESATSMVAVGDQGKVVRFQGDRVIPVATAITSRLNDVWGIDGSEVWAVGDGGTVLRIIGDIGYRIPTPVDNGPSLLSVWGSSKDNVWAVGALGTVIRWDGSRWNQLSAPDSMANYVSIFGTSPNDVWLLGSRQIFRWDGLVWRLVRKEQEQVLGGFARSPTDVWVLREFQRLSNFNGSVWSRDVIPVATVTTVTDIAPAAGSGVWAAGTHGMISRGQDGFWADTSGQTPTQNRRALEAIWSASTEDAWACGPTVLLHWDGRNWDAASTGADIDCTALFGSARDDVWMFGRTGTVWHYDGLRWVIQPQTFPGVSFLGGVAVSRTAAYAVGSGGTILVWDGTMWSAAPKLVSTALRTAWAATPSDIWVVGEAGVILRGQGTTWSLIPKPTSASFYAVHGTSASDVHLVGAELWYWNGSSFAQFPRASATPSLPSSVNLRDVVVRTDGTALAVGDFGAVVQYRQGAWSVLSYGDTRSLVRMNPATATDAWVVGDAQTVLRYSP